MIEGECQERVREREGGRERERDFEAIVHVVVRCFRIQDLAPHVTLLHLHVCASS